MTNVRTPTANREYAHRADANATPYWIDTDEDFRPEEMSPRFGYWTPIEEPDGAPTMTAPCPVCHAPQPRQSTFGVLACDHQIDAGLVGNLVGETTNPNEKGEKST